MSAGAVADDGASDGQQHAAFDGALEGTGAVSGVEAFAGDQLEQRRLNVDAELAARDTTAPQGLVDFALGDLAHRLFVQGKEGDHSVDAVDEFGRKLCSSSRR